MPILVSTRNCIVNWTINTRLFLLNSTYSSRRNEFEDEDIDDEDNYSFDELIQNARNISNL